MSNGKMGFLQCHVFTPVSDALLVRDMQGLHKRSRFGGVSRTRISSQSEKFWIRKSSGDKSLSSLSELAVRSRLIFSIRVFEAAKAAVEAEGLVLDKDIVSFATLAVKKMIVAAKDEKEKKEKVSDTPAEEEAPTESEEGDVTSLEMKQVIVLGQAEIWAITSEVVRLCHMVKDGLIQITAKGDIEAPMVVTAPAPSQDKKSGKEKKQKKELSKDAKKTVANLKANLAVLGASCGLDTLLFGRMGMGDVIKGVDGCVYVAHSFTVHEELSEGDEFAAVDDLTENGGAGHLNNTELASGLYYGYKVIDLDPLREGLLKYVPEDALREKFLRDILDHLIWLFTTRQMGAKKGSTAPFTRASMLMVEVGTSQPASLAQAFDRPIRPGKAGMHWSACTALANFLEDRNACYPELRNKEFVMAVGGPENPLFKVVGQAVTMGIGAIVEAATAAAFAEAGKTSVGG